MKINMGWIGNNNGDKKDIIIDQSALEVKDYIIGVLLGPLGVFYVADKAFGNGVNAMDKTEHDVMVSLGLIKD